MRMHTGTPNSGQLQTLPYGEHRSRSARSWSVWWILIALSLGFVWAGIAVAASLGELKINRVNPGPVGGNVDVFLTATYSDGSPISLTKESFAVQVGDRPAAPPSGVSPPSEQLSIVFVMDFTTTVRVSGGLQALQDATEGFVKQMQPGDWTAIVKYNIDKGAAVVSPFAPLVTPVDGNGDSALNEVIYADYDGAGTNLNAALKRALDHVAASSDVLPDGRTAIVLLADGEDNYVEYFNFEKKPEPGETGVEVVALANELNVPIFTIGVADVRAGGDGAWLDRMQNLAAQTGGEYFDAVDEPKAAIDQAYATTSELLTTEYQVTFAGVDNCEPQDFTVSVESLDLEASGVFTHRGCETSGGSSSSSGGGGAFGPLGLIAGLSLLALRRRLVVA